MELQERKKERRFVGALDYVDQDRDNCQTVVNIVMNIRFPYLLGIS
jgi:hypothetical protein